MSLVARGSKMELAPEFPYDPLKYHVTVFSSLIIIFVSAIKHIHSFREIEIYCQDLAVKEKMKFFGLYFPCDFHFDSFQQVVEQAHKLSTFLCVTLPKMPL